LVGEEHLLQRIGESSNLASNLGVTNAIFARDIGELEGRLKSLEKMSKLS
jgi:hypothetical protein